jgi:predicted nucleic acid-binding Zn ribbon protein
MKKYFKPIGSSLKSILKEHNLDDDYNEYYIITNWDKIVNSNIAKITSPIKLVNKVLTIKTKTESWKKELKIKKKHIISIINKSDKISKIEDINFIL